MNKKFLFGMFAAATMLFATSCSNDELDGVQSGKESVVSFTLEQPGIATRSYSDGTTATKLTYAVYEKGSKTAIIDKVVNNAFENKTASVDFRLVTGKTYEIIFWADAETSPYSFDKTTQSITVNYDNAENNDEGRDAFFAAEEITVNGPVNEPVTMTRPFAQLNIGTTDDSENAVIAFNPTQSSVKVTNIPNVLNLLTGAVSGATETGIEYTLANIPSGEDFPVTDVKYLSMSYLLMSEEKALVDVTFNIKGGTHSIERSYSAVPVQRNYRTNIYGKILTDPAAFNITINATYETPNTDYIIDENGNVVQNDNVVYSIEDMCDKMDNGVLFLADDMVIANGDGMTGTGGAWSNNMIWVGNDYKDYTTTSEDLVLNLNGKTLTANSWAQAGSVLRGDNGKTLTVNGPGSVVCIGITPLIRSNNGGSVIINGGTYIRQTACRNRGVTVHNAGGKVIINDGYFDCNFQAEEGSTRVDECYSNLYDYTESNAITIYNGSFVGFDPTLGQPASGADETIVSWFLEGQTEKGVLPDGYTMTTSTHEDGRTIYTISYSK